MEIWLAVSGLVSILLGVWFLIGFIVWLRDLARRYTWSSNDDE
jgi:hypothetical protein